MNLKLQNRLIHSSFKRSSCFYVKEFDVTFCHFLSLCCSLSLVRAIYYLLLTYSILPSFLPSIPYHSVSLNTLKIVFLHHGCDEGNYHPPCYDEGNPLQNPRMSHEWKQIQLGALLHHHYHHHLSTNQ